MMPLLPLLNLLFKHLEGSKTHARISFVDCSSAFNTIQPHILVDKLLKNFDLDFNIVRRCHHPLGLLRGVSFHLSFISFILTIAAASMKIDTY